MAFEDGYRPPANVESRMDCVQRPRIGNVLFTVFVATTSAVIATVTTVSVMTKHAAISGHQTELIRRPDERELFDTAPSAPEQKAGYTNGPVVMKYTGCTNWEKIVISSVTIEWKGTIDALILDCSDKCRQEEECEAYNVAIPEMTEIKKDVSNGGDTFTLLESSYTDVSFEHLDGRCTEQSRAPKHNCIILKYGCQYEENACFDLLVGNKPPRQGANYASKDGTVITAPTFP